MKKTYEAPSLFEIRFISEEKLMVSVTDFDSDVDNETVKLPEINIFG